jgi:glutaminase
LIFIFISAIEMNCEELANLFFFFANETKFGKTSFDQESGMKLNAVMQTCGFYIESGGANHEIYKSGIGAESAVSIPICCSYLVTQG